jgi:hypothetical protein
MVASYKKVTRRHLALKKRDVHGISEKELVYVRILQKMLLKTIIMRQKYRKYGILTDARRKNFKKVIRYIGSSIFIDMMKIEVEEPSKIRRSLKQRMRKTTVYDFDRNDYSSKFRWRSPEDLERLINGLGFPEIIKINKYVFTSHEVVMISLMRLAYPLRWTDILDKFPGREQWECSKAFYYFLDFMIANWGYLILNNRDYWKPFLADSANAIREKLAELPNEDYRMYYDNPNERTGFAIFGFIDNTMIAMCRPGGGPVTDGIQAERVDRLVQQAWWTGWKTFHGMKWQTAGLANGMDFEIWGPVSVRHPDAYTLARSKIEEKLEILQRNDPLQFKMYGDSAYFDDEYMVTGGGRGMSSVRESIEWSYKDMKTLWKACTFKSCLKIRRQPLPKIFFVCFLLRNIHCTFYQCQSAGYFTFPAPEFEHYISQGKKGRPLPDDSIFSVNYRLQNDEDDFRVEDLNA